MSYSKKVKFYDATSGNVLIGDINSEDLGIDIKTDDVASSNDEGDKPEPVGFGGTVTLKGKFNKDDPGQAGLITKALAGTHLSNAKMLYYGTVGGSGSGFQGEAIIGGLKFSSGKQKHTDFTVDFKWYGVPSWSTTL